MSPPSPFWSSLLRRTAHRLLADHDPTLAPALYFFHPVISDMHTIVIEYLLGVSPLPRFI